MASYGKNKSLLPKKIDGKVGINHEIDKKSNPLFTANLGDADLDSIFHQIFFQWILIGIGGK
jgi:hypothetical protein